MRCDQINGYLTTTGWEVAVFCYSLRLGNMLRFTRKGTTMSTYSLPDLLHQWAQGNLTADQAVGHLIQNLLTLLHRLTDLEKRLRQLEQPHPEGTRKPKP